MTETLRRCAASALNAIATSWSRSSPCRAGGCRCSARRTAIRDFIMFAHRPTACSRPRSTCWSATPAWSRSGTRMFFGLGRLCFGLAMQKLGKFSIPVAFALTHRRSPRCSPLVIGAICVRLKEIYFAFLTLAFQMLIYNIILVLGVVHRRRPGPARAASRGRHSSASTSPTASSSTSFCSRAVHRRPRSSMRQIVQSPFGYTLRMIRDNPGARRLPRHRRLARAKLVCLRHRGLFGVGRRHADGAVRVRRLSQLRAIWTISGEAHLHDHAGRHQRSSWGRWSAPCILRLLNDVVTRYTEHTRAWCSASSSCSSRWACAKVCSTSSPSASRSGARRRPRRCATRPRRQREEAMTRRSREPRKVLRRRAGDQRRHARLRRRLAHAP